MNEITQSSTGLVIPKDVSEEQFFDYGSKLAQADKTLQWYIGDWYNAIPWGDKKAACEKVGLNYKTARDYGRICERYQLSIRIDNCTFKHHQVIAALPEPERLPLLQQAVEKHWSTSVLKKQAFPEQPPKKEEEKMPFSWLDIATEEGILNANANGEKRKRIKAELEQIDPDCFKEKDAGRFRTACRILWKMQNPGSESKSEAEAKEAKATLPKTAQEKFERALKQWEAARIVELRVEFAKQLKEAVTVERQRLEEELEKAKEAADELSRERDAAYQIRLGIDSHMTMDEFQLVRNCLHPDRAPEDRKERFTKAFNIFNRLEKTVNTKKPLSVLRQNGWEKASPYYKPH